MENRQKQYIFPFGNNGSQTQMKEVVPGVQRQGEQIFNQQEAYAICHLAARRQCALEEDWVSFLGNFKLTGRPQRTTATPESAAGLTTASASQATDAAQPLTPPQPAKILGYAAVAPAKPKVNGASSRPCLAHQPGEGDTTEDDGTFTPEPESRTTVPAALNVDGKGTVPKKGNGPTVLSSRRPAPQLNRSTKRKRSNTGKTKDKGSLPPTGEQQIKGVEKTATKKPKGGRRTRGNK